MDVSLIFPHQLFGQPPALCPERQVVMVEDPLFFGGDRYWPLQFHRKKLILHRASMQAYAVGLREQGYVVRYEDWCAGVGVIQVLAELTELRELHYCDPVDDVLSRRLERFGVEAGVKLVRYESPNFLTSEEECEELLGGKKPFMATFYKAQRKRLGILMEGEQPVGRKWSYDEENRKALPKKLAVPEPPFAKECPYVKEACEYVRKSFPDALGSDYRFNYPVTNEQAEEWLEGFLHERFHLFGDYEDAVSSKHRVIFHSVLTPVLNIGLLSPKLVVDRALEFGVEHKVPLNSLEGFVRQVIGWREFMRGMYVKYGVEERNSNFWGFEYRPIPQAFYDGSTGINPIDETIHRVLEDGYCHHIERLMILGNFMLLCRMHPTEVYKWFMELFVDAYDWVMVPNVYGMSQFADGGIFTTKPYVSGSNYVRKMSDYKKGEWCDVWDGLFWSFIGDFHEVFSKNARMSRMTWMYDKMDAEKKAKHHAQAEQFLDQLYSGLN